MRKLLIIIGCAVTTHASVAEACAVSYRAPSAAGVAQMVFQYGAPVLAELTDVKEVKVGVAGRNEVTIRQATLKIVDTMTAGNSVGTEFITTEMLQQMCGEPNKFSEAGLHKKAGYFVMRSASDKDVNINVVQITEQQYDALKADLKAKFDTKIQASSEKE